MLFDLENETPDLEIAAILLADMARAPEPDDEPLVWDVPLLIGETAITMRVLAGAEDDVAFFVLGCEIYDLDFDRLEAMELPPPLEGWDVDFGDDEPETDEPEPDDDDTADEELPWLALSAECPLAEGVAGIERCLGAAGRFIQELAEAGVIDVVDASEVDPDLAARAAVLEDMKASQPREAMELARHLGARCRALGDYRSGAWFDMAASEVAEDLGQMTLCWELASSAWATLGEPVDEALVVGAYALALSVVGRDNEAIRLLERAEAAMTDAGDAAYIRGNKGVLLGRMGRLSEAIGAIDASVDEPELDSKSANRLRRTLATFRQQLGGRAAPEREQVDLLDEADDVINDIAHYFELPADPAAFMAGLPRIEEQVADVSQHWDRLGPNQRARLLLAESSIARFRGDGDVANRKLRQARAIAAEAGHPALVRWVDVVSASMITDAELPAELLADATPTERLMVYFNRTFYGTMAAIGRGVDEAEAFEPMVAPALQAVRVVDEERHAFDRVGDRSGWAAFGGRVYELALVLTTVLGHRHLVVELLERVRAQGVPEAPDEGTSAEYDLGDALDELDVGVPRIATVTGESRVLPGAPTVRLADLVARVGGTNAWWWTCHSFGQRLFWAVRAPYGEIFVGNKITEPVEGDDPSLASVARLFATPSVLSDVADHVLFDDRRGRLDRVLRRLADAVLPPPIADAARLAASAGRPIRLVWAPPPSLGNVPIGLLPIDDEYRLLHGAIVTTAPPTSLLLPTPRNTHTASVPATAILGEGADLRHAADIAGPAGLGLPPERVFGTWAHVQGSSLLAGSVATPGAVIRAWSDDPPPLALYYGHVDEGRPGAPLTASLRLAGQAPGSEPAPLLLRPLLAGPRQGAPRVVVLCACSSLGPKTMGSGEWWGFGVALLWQGSQYVVGSLWNLVDGPATARFAVELVEALQVQPDPSVALHQLQLRWLADWEERWDNAYTSTAADRHPVVWAGWSVTGAAN